MKPAFALLFGVALVGCTSDEGYVSVRVAARPAANARVNGLSAVPLTQGSSTTELADSSALVATAPTEGALGIAASEIGGVHLLVTVTEVNVKVQGKKHGHGHGHGHDECNDGDEHGAMHEAADDGAGADTGDDGDHDDNGEHDNGDGGGPDGRGHKHGHHGHWTNIFSGHQSVDLFDLSAAGAFLAGGSVPSGMLREIRLVLAGDVTLVNGTMSWPVQCPSCSTSGLKIKTHGVNVIEGGELALSVDLRQSLSGDPTSGYVLHPVIHLQSVTCADHGDDQDGEQHGEH